MVMARHNEANSRYQEVETKERRSFEKNKNEKDTVSDVVYTLKFIEEIITNKKRNNIYIINN